MSTPAMIYLALMVFGMGISLTKHGETRNGAHSLPLTLITSGIVIGLLYWGGFFASRP